MDKQWLLVKSVYGHADGAESKLVGMGICVLRAGHPYKAIGSRERFKNKLAASVQSTEKCEALSKLIFDIETCAIQGKCNIIIFRVDHNGFWIPSNLLIKKPTADLKSEFFLHELPLRNLVRFSSTSKPRKMHVLSRNIANICKRHWATTVTCA